MIDDRTLRIVSHVEQLEGRVAELEKLVAMMRHAIDVAVLRVEPYPDDSKPAQFTPEMVKLPYGDLPIPDIDDSPLAPAER